MNITTVVVLSLLELAVVVSAGNELLLKYRFSAILDPEGQYKLYWSYNLNAQTISFAVRVQTTGWVGFGLSPTSGMVGSDVVIGWVESNGTVQFHDRYAERQALPPIDASQDWFLVSGEEENGFTILEFSRNLTSCDDRDLNVGADTTRTVWSFSSVDPSDVIYHEFRGTTSLNLLGGLNEDRSYLPDKIGSFIIRNENLTIPSETDTTYWCSGFQLPPEVREQERYIFKFSPVITEGSSPHVHHLLVYLCDTIEPNTLNSSGSQCDSAPADIRGCRYQAIAAWAIGGTDFIYPEKVAYPIGGPGNPEFMVIEMHYDNPHFRSGVIDSSGMEFIYTSTRPVYKAGILGVGHRVSHNMVIPPNADNFLIQSICTDTCIQQSFPDDGITVIGSLLHTHLVGHGLVLQHFRPNEECGLLEELEPIDSNLKYDFNYQQFNILPREVRILPGDSLLLQCFYSTANRTNVTLGGESTHEEMCFSFLIYYPQVDLAYCGSTPRLPKAYRSFAKQYNILSNKYDQLMRSFQSDSEIGIRDVLDEVYWTPDAIQSLQESVINSDILHHCIDNKPSFFFLNTIYPTVECPYETPDICTTDSELRHCCDHLSNSPTSSSTPSSGTNSCMSILLIIFFAFFVCHYAL